MQPTLYSSGALFAQNPHELCNRSAVNNVNKTDASVYCDLSVLEPDNSTYHLACVAGGALRSLYDAVSDGTTRFLKRIYAVGTAMDKAVSLSLSLPVAYAGEAEEDEVEDDQNGPYGFQRKIKKLVHILAEKGCAQNKIEQTLSLIDRETQLDAILDDLEGHLDSYDEAGLRRYIIRSLGYGYATDKRLTLAYFPSGLFREDLNQQLGKQIIRFIDDNFSDLDAYIQQYLIARCIDAGNIRMVYDKFQRFLSVNYEYRAAYLSDNANTILFTEANEYDQVMVSILNHEFEHCGWDKMYGNNGCYWPRGDEESEARFDTLIAHFTKKIRSSNNIVLTIKQEADKYGISDYDYDTDYDTIIGLFDEFVLDFTNNNKEQTLRFSWFLPGADVGDTVTLFNHELDIVGRTMDGLFFVETEYNIECREKSRDEFLFALSLLMWQLSIIEKALVALSGDAASVYSAGWNKQEYRPNLRSNVEHFLSDRLLEPFDHYALGQIESFKKAQKARCRAAWAHRADEAVLKAFCLEKGAIDIDWRVDDGGDNNNYDDTCDGGE